MQNQTIFPHINEASSTHPHSPCIGPQSTPNSLDISHRGLHAHPKYRFLWRIQFTPIEGGISQWLTPTHQRALISASILSSPVRALPWPWSPLFRNMWVRVLKYAGFAGTCLALFTLYIIYKHHAYHLRVLWLNIGDWYLHFTYSYPYLTIIPPWLRWKT